ncbi:MAG: aminomethyl-transferring glycine dehydrogenase subunit GcvPB [Planctomycetota bacterium]|jgi:glycine dehydrogenase subunit 2
MGHRERGGLVSPQSVAPSAGGAEAAVANAETAPEAAQATCPAPGPLALGAEPVPELFEKSRPGRQAVRLPASGVEEQPLEVLLPAWTRRERPAELPELSELQVVRHYTRLSRKNFSIDERFYPLGSCTMKYNPRVNEHTAALPGFSDLHPYQPDEDVQGMLECWHRLEGMLQTITGLPAISMQPAAGAHGELTGLFVIRAYHESRGEAATRTKVLIPDSAHGTNPASVVLAGMKAVGLKTGEDGRVCFEDLVEKLDDGVAALMITNPSTLGLFESRIQEVADALHEAGALLYMDGANLNAMLGWVRPGDFGVDVMHINMHKTLSTPHGGGGPGSGPIAVAKILEPFLPVPRVAYDEPTGVYRLSTDHPQTIGRMKAFVGHMGMVTRAYTYLRAHGWRDLRAIAEYAVLNANYILARLKGRYELPYEGPCMHEVVFSARLQKKNGVSALDIAKRLLDKGFHAPTIYFPLIVKEALMIEPTETEAKETLDLFCEAMLEIADEAEQSPELVQSAPTRLPLRRLDEVAAARRPCIRWCPG